MSEKYLPIGTVCRLRDGQKNLMIIGFCQSPSENSNVIYDYNGCLYPEGVISPEINFLFNHNQIEEILYTGYESEEDALFKKRLKEFISTGKIDGQEINVDDNGNITLSNNQINSLQGKKTDQTVANAQQVVTDTLQKVQTQIPPIKNNTPDVNTNLSNNLSAVNSIPTFNTLNLNDQNN